METIDNIIGIWMVFAGISLAAYADSLVLYMSTLSGAELYITAITSAVLLGTPAGALIAVGWLQAIGKVTIRIEEGGK